MDLDGSEQEKKEIKKGFEDDEGFFAFMLGGIYWNFDVLKFSKYKKATFLHSILVNLCMIWLFIFFTCSAVLSIIEKDIEAIVESCNFAVITFNLSAVNMMAIYNRKMFDYYFREIGRGFFRYEGELQDERTARIYFVERRKMLKKLLWPFCITIGLVACFVTMVQPFVHYIEGNVDLSINRPIYSPMVIYTPWNPHTPIGYSLYILTVIFNALFMLQSCVGMDFGFMNLISSLTLQFKILNHSVKTIQKRAMQRYVRKNGKEENFYKDPLFQECIYECLIQNIKHHHALIKFKSAISPYLSGVLLLAVTNSSVLVAANGFMLLESRTDIMTLKKVCMVALVLAHTNFFCSFGAELTTESENLFSSLYTFPWYKFSVKVRKTQLMFMMNVRKPVQIKAAYFGIPANMATFNSLLNSSYTYINLLRTGTMR